MMERRDVLALGIGLAAAGMTVSDLSAGVPGAARMADGARELSSLIERLARAPRRRDFKTVPMILDRRDLWDHEALDELITYKGGPRQVWDNTELAGPWLNLMRNAVNNQVWSFRHLDFLAVSATHGSAHFALYNQLIWDKYGITKVAGEKFATNTLIVPRNAAAADPKNYQDAAGVFSPENNSIPALQSRGVVFLSCHNAIWEQAAALLKSGSNPDKLSHEALAAELTNHLIPHVVLTPGAVGTLPELQATGYFYAK